MPAINRRLVNPVQRLWAPWLPPFALVVHRGRTSGVEHRTPVLAWRHGATLYVSLYYGERAHWVRNVLAGGGAVVRLGRRWRIAGARILRDEELPRRVRVVALGRSVLALELQRS
jgi:deazaflavin-dependent oxidoreductase (nitroreductase family)